MIKVLNGVFPKSLIILAAVANTAEEFQRTVYLTSGNDRKHMKGSLHYKDRAVDIRSRDFPNSAMKYAFLAKVLNRLGSDYQGILENENGPNEHFHFEHDPKVPLERKTLKA